MKCRLNTSLTVIGKPVFLLLCCFGASLAAHADSQKFLCVQGVEGSTRDEQFQGCSDVFAYSQSLVSDADPSSGANERVFQCGEASIVKQIDAASPPLLISVLSGTVIPSLTVHFRSKDVIPVVFLTIELTNVIIEGVTNSEFSNSTGASELPIDMETLALAAAVVTFTYIPTETDGSPGTPIGAEIDCARKTARPF